jgi:hypothetical protein
MLTVLHPKSGYANIFQPIGLTPYPKSTLAIPNLSPPISPKRTNHMSPVRERYSDLLIPLEVLLLKPDPIQNLAQICLLDTLSLAANLHQQAA